MKFIAILLLPFSMLGSDSLKDDLSARVLEIDFYSNSTYLGRNSGVKYPYLSLSYLEESRKGWWINPMVNHLFNAGHSIDEVDLSVGKDFVFRKKGEGSISYTRYFFHKDSPTLRSGLRNNAELTIARNGRFYMALSPNLNFGETGTDFFLVGDLAKAFYKDDIFKKGKDYLRLRPKLSLVAGTRTIYEDFIVYGPGGKNGKGKSGKNTTVISETVQTSSTVFRLNSLILRLPLRYTYETWSVQFSYAWALPLNPTAGEKAFGYYTISTWLSLK